ncbi:hypothetical protein [Argonema antarcticum]|uniref:hypothetical protein n=1 Tax=Argonema antarcticum TaxID=2942763 RepID=UPI0020135D81|nr:hypothetical protein [Argonema antarcticum]
MSSHSHLPCKCDRTSIFPQMRSHFHLCPKCVGVACLTAFAPPSFAECDRTNN